MSHRHATVRFGFNADVEIACVLLLLGLALAGLAAVAFPLDEAITTGIYLVD